MVSMKKTETVKEEINHYYCDYCSKEITSRCSSWQCGNCLRDICPKHSIEDPLADNSGDRTDYVCVDCFDIMKPFVKQIQAIKEESDAKIEKLELEMKEKCGQSNTIPPSKDGDKVKFELSSR